ncbi:uncharacterized protein LOC126973873 [Leptidea sinapis]|uniref:uncharacterized protein LOC126973873 n=1 Tax=Leptidea sinapis TaxID=189913 RepID=UPI0021C2C6D7|nr:uncharacterized protein LOC126973873 [Leptidea sinapis]
MSGFKALRDVSNDLRSDLRLLATRLFRASVPISFEDSCVKKIKDISLLTSKLRLVNAKVHAETPEIRSLAKDEFSTMNNYTDTVVWKLIEQQSVKVLLQSHSVKLLVTTPDSQLHPQLVERKE